MCHAVLLAVFTAVILFRTVDAMPMVWDEGEYLRRTEKATAWFQLGNEAWSREAIKKHWQTTVVVEGHPAGFVWLIGFGQLLGGDSLSAARWGSLMLAAMAAGGMGYRLCRDWSALAAWSAVAALLVQPRLFAHLHFATLDGPLTCAWLLAVVALPSAFRRWQGAVVWGLLVGLTLSIKFTGWLALPGFALWCWLYRPQQAVRTMLIGFGTAWGMFILLNPPLWCLPLWDWDRFFRLNLNRAGFNISGYFFGQFYDLNHSLPWYNTLVWTFIAVPVGLLIPFVIGLIASWRTPGDAPRKWLPSSQLALPLIPFLVLLIIRSLPGAPPHDGIRMFLPAFGFLAWMAGLGSHHLVRWLERVGKKWASEKEGGSRKLLARLAWCGWPTGMLWASAAVSTVWYFPQGLSYYNLLIGGLRGATACGMEPTYYWDGLDRSVQEWLKLHTRPGEYIEFGSCSVENLKRMQAWGNLPPVNRGETLRWYVLQNRPTGLRTVEKWLREHEQPAFQYTIRPATSGWGPWRLDVPLVEVYSAAQYDRARRASRQK